MTSELPDWVADPALANLWWRLRDRLERTGLSPSGRVRVPLETRRERHAVGALLGIPVTRDVVTVDLAALDARLKARSWHGGLVDVLAVVTATPLRNRTAEREARIAQREGPLELLGDLVGGLDGGGAERPWVGTWLADVRRTGLLARATDPMATARDAAVVVEALLAGDGSTTVRSRVELAADLLGDAHALDEDRALHRVVLRALAAARGESIPATAADRWALWESAGVAPDAVSSTCLTLGLLPDDEIAPRHLTRWDLRTRRSFRDVPGPVLVCENPRVLEACAETQAGRVPVVCTAGEPNLVVAAVLSGLVDAGVPLRYHGDFDWPGLAIANRVIARYGAQPFLMSAADYESQVRSDAPELTGSPVEPCWDAELGPAMRARRRSLHEETVLPQLLAAMW
jgi:uncharacterized protein (TIGR02679 family)